MKKLGLFLLLCFVGASTAWATPDRGLDDPPPWGNSIFVRGGFNDWGTTDEMIWNGATAEYTAVLTIDAGDWEFKIADETWSNPDWGAIGDPNITLGTPIDIGPASFGNLVLSIATPGQYLFVLDNLIAAPTLGGGGVGPQSGTLTVSAVVPVPAALLLFGSSLLGFGFFRRR